MSGMIPGPPTEVIPSSPGSDLGSGSITESLLTCPTPILQLFNGFVVQEPALIPTCLLAALIGFTGFAKIRKTSVTGHFSYSISFFLFGCMMSDAMFVHCFLYNPTHLGYLVEWIDVTLTSCVAISFGFNGFVDLGWLDETSRCARKLMVAVYLLTGLAWYYTIVHNSTSGFMFLYIGVIAISCGIYTVAEIISTLSHHGRGLPWLLLGGGLGAFGMYTIVSQDFNLELCVRLGPNLGGEFLWFLLSDFSMYCLFRYFWSSKNVSNSTAAITTIPYSSVDVVYALTETPAKSPPVLEKSPPILL